ACTFSLALCLGRITHISRRAVSFSSAVRPFLYLASASWYCGGRLTAMTFPRIALRDCIEDDRRKCGPDPVELIGIQPVPGHVEAAELVPPTGRQQFADARPAQILIRQ